jgi:hypothetical protein
VQVVQNGTATLVVLAGDKGRTLYSINRGLTWETRGNTFTTNNLYALAFTSYTDGWV